MSNKSTINMIIPNTIDSIFKSEIHDLKIYGGVGGDPKSIIDQWTWIAPCYIIYETLSSTSFATWKGDLPNERIIRFRIFNQEGDLDIRYLENEYRWRYVGTQTLGKKNQSWILPDGARMFFEEKSFYLWGKKKQGKKRFESRVAKANLEYPISSNEGFVKIKCRIYSVDGIVSFVQYLGIETAKGE